MSCEAALSFMKVISAEAYTAEGLDIHFLAFDEFHAQPNKKLWDAVKYGGAGRIQPMTLIITTAGYDRESVCFEKHAYTKKINSGIIEDDSFFGCIYAADEDDDWRLPETWRKANPSLGYTLNEEDMAASVKEVENAPSNLNSFKRYRLNIWTQNENTFLDMKKWDKCETENKKIEDLYGSPCYAGLDLASTTDIASLVLVFPDGKGGFDVICEYFVPEENIEKRSLVDGIDYQHWVDDGFIHATPGNVIDFDFIRQRVNRLGGYDMDGNFIDDKDVFEIRKIAVDAWNSTQLQTQLSGDGFDVVKYGQSFKNFTSPTKLLERLVMQNKIHHFNNPVQRWMASNTAVTRSADGEIRPSKQKSSEKIDGIVSEIMALGVAETENADNYISTVEMA